MNPYAYTSDADPTEDIPKKDTYYIDDTFESPPSYSVVQSNDSSSTTVRMDRMDTRQPTATNTDYPEIVATEPETTQLMASERTHHLPTAPSLDQLEFGLEDSSHKKKKAIQRCTAFRFLVAFTILATGITFMSAILAHYSCYRECEEKDDCESCPTKAKDGYVATVFVFIILSTLSILAKTIRCVLHYI